MKLSHTQPCVLLLLLLLICCACLLQPGEARGGRGRGGGSFGGLFGGWRSKYGSKSSSSSGGGRRVVSGSPVHTAMNVPKVPPPPPPPPKPMPKPQIPSYPRQQLPPGYNYAAAAPGAGTYYANAQALPTGAVYYAQPPSSMGSGTSGFLTGMLAGRLMDSMLFGHRHHVTHVYHQNPQGEAAAAATANGREIIVINHGQQQSEASAPVEVSLNEPQSPQNPPQTSEDASAQQQEATHLSAESGESTAPPEMPVGSGIVCFPIRLNETDPQQPEVQHEVERIVCFPAPNPADCQNNPECLLELGISTTSSTEPPIVAGDIGGSLEEDADSVNLEVSSAVPDVTM